MKGTKGMQKKVILFLMFLFGISNNASSLELRRSEASLNGASENFSNIAFLNDIVNEKSNEAFLPETSSIIEYKEVSSTPISIENVEPVNLLKDVPSKKIAVVVPRTENKKHTKKSSKSQRSFASVNKSKNVEQTKQKNISSLASDEILVSTFAAKSPISEIKDSPIIAEQTTQKVAKIDDADTSPFGVSVSKTTSADATKDNPFIRAFSVLKPEKISKNKKVNKTVKEVKISSVSPEFLKKDLNKTYLSENKYLSPVEDIEDDMEDEIDEEFEEDAEETAEEYAENKDFSSQKNVKDALEGKGPIDINTIKEKISSVKKNTGLPSGPLKVGAREVLQMKIDFQDGSSAVSGESVNLLRSFAQIANEQPTNSIEISLPQSVMSNPKDKKITARRLSLVSNILRDAGISDKQIKPVLSDRDMNSFTFRVVGNDTYSKYRVSKGTDIFGDDESVKEYDIMKW